jgi:hypothetical protein
MDEIEHSRYETIIEVPDGLCRQANAEAAMGGRKLKDAPPKARQKPGLADLMKRAQGMIDSGIPDLASNPGHLKGFGRNARDRRHARSNDDDDPKSLVAAGTI